MCCFFAILAVLGPKFGILVWWLVDPSRWEKSFNGFLWPFLGFLFLPWTTLMYVVVRPGDVVGFDWVWLGISLLLDLAMYSGGAYKRDQVPGYSAYTTRYGD